MQTETHSSSHLNPVAVQHVHEAGNLLKFFNVLLKNSLQNTLLNMNLYKTNSSDSFYQPFKQIMKSLSNIDAQVTIALTDKEVVIYKGSFVESIGTPIKMSQAEVGKELDYLTAILDPKQLSYLSSKPISKLLSKTLQIGPKTSLWGLQIDPLHTTSNERVYILLSVTDKDAHHQFQ